MQYFIIAKLAIKCLKWLSKRSENQWDDELTDFVGDVIDVAKPDDFEKIIEIKKIVKN